MKKPRQPEKREIEPAAPAEETRMDVPLGPPGPDMPAAPGPSAPFPPREPGQMPEDEDTGMWILPFDDTPL